MLSPVGRAMFRVEGQVSHAKTVSDAWLASEFEGGRSAPKVEKITETDRRFHVVRETWRRFC